MNNNKNNWIFSFDSDKNISFAIASVLNGYMKITMILQIIFKLFNQYTI